MASRIKYIVLVISITIVCGLANTPIALDAFTTAKIQSINARSNTEQIDFNKNKQLLVSDFFKSYQKALGLSRDLNYSPQSEIRDNLGERHIRYNIEYKGISVAEMVYILHVKDGKVFRSNGNKLKGLNIDIQPGLSMEQALQAALKKIGATAYMWQSPKVESFLKREQDNPQASFFPQGKLMLSAGRLAKTASNFKLVYCFDIYARAPLSRQWVDVDAHNGKIINVMPRIWNDDITTSGKSRYDGMVPITVSNQNFPKREYSFWHTSTFNALSHSGKSWWMADTSLGYNGGYANVWYQTLDSDPITLNGNNLNLQFAQRYAVETPGGEPAGYDGWDGLNVRISVDSAKTWQALTNPQPAYTASSLYSFGEIHGEGFNVPGWAGENRNWHIVNFDLSGYKNKTVQLRFAFASDAGFSTNDGDSSLFGWQVDNIKVSNDSSVLFSNHGETNGFTPNVREIIVAGNYRLRRSGVPGIMTFSTLNTTAYSLAVDVVSNDSVFTADSMSAGVSAQWVAEEVYKYYKTQFNRDSYDNKGSRILSYVNFDNNYGNAFWDGSRMSFGDGSNNSTPFTSVDVAAHELTHAVTEFSANLIYQDEPGALNESFSDVFGTAIEFYVKPDKANWLIGEDLGTFRSMSHPEAYGDPDTYEGFNWHQKGGSDNGGVHTNSGVQNKWFYLLSAGDAGTNDKGDNYNVSGIGVSNAARIAYRNLTVYLTPSAQYADARQGSIMAARDLFGEKSQQYASTIAAWNAVGVYYPVAQAQLIAPTIATLSRTEVSSTSDTLHLFISNSGIDTLLIRNIQTDNSHFKLAATFQFPRLLKLGDSLDIPLVFRPDSEKTFYGRLQIYANDTVNVALQGSGYVVHAVTALQKYALSAEALFDVEDVGPSNKIGPTGLNGISALGIRPSDYILIGAKPNGKGTTFYRINAKSGEAFILTSIPNDHLDKISFEPGSDLPLALDSRSGILYRVNLENARADSIGATELSAVVGLAVNPLNGILWAAKNDGSLFNIDKQTAQATSAGKTNSSNSRSIAFDSNGQLFALSGITGTTAELLGINTSSGKTQALSSTGQNLIALRIADANATAIHKNPIPLPRQFYLGQNYPNPFNPVTQMEFSIPQNTHVNLDVFNSSGQKVAQLVNGMLDNGSYTVSFDASAMASGVYFYVLRVGKNFVQTKKLILLK